MNELNRPRTKCTSRCLTRAIVETLDPRRLFTAGPATPALSVALSATDAQHAVVLSYTIPDGSHLELEEQAQGDGNFHVVNGSLDSSAGTHTLAVSGLAPDHAYRFRVRADRDGLLAYAAADVTTDPGAPNPNQYQTFWPVGLNTPANFTITDGEFPDTSEYTFQTEYDLNGSYTQNVEYHSRDPRRLYDPYVIGSFTISRMAEGNDQWRAWDYLPASPYAYEARLMISGTNEDWEDVQSPWTDARTFQIDQFQLNGTPLPLPAAPALTAVATTDGTAKVRYTVGAAAYGQVLELYRLVDGHTTHVAGVSLPAAGASGAVTLPGVEDSQIFGFVHLGDTYSTQAFSAYSSNVPGDGSVVAPAAPQNLSATVGEDEKIHLVWDNVPNNETGFAIQRSSDGVLFDELTTTGPDTTAYADDSAEAGTTYIYRVYSQGSDGLDSEPSNEANAHIRAVYVEATDASASEDNRDPAVFTIQFSVPVAFDMWVNFSLSGSAIAVTGVDSYGSPTPIDADYTVEGAQQFGSSWRVLIPAGISTAAVKITPLNDSATEDTEAATITLNGQPYPFDLSAPPVDVLCADPSTNPATLPATAEAQIKSLLVVPITGQPTVLEIEQHMNDLDNMNSAIRDAASNWLRDTYARYPICQSTLAGRLALAEQGQYIPEVATRLKQILTPIRVQLLPNKIRISLDSPPEIENNEQWYLIVTVDSDKLIVSFDPHDPSLNACHAPIGTSGPFSDVILTPKSVTASDESVVVHITLQKRNAMGAQLEGDDARVYERVCTWRITEI